MSHLFNGHTKWIGALLLRTRPFKLASLYCWLCVWGACSSFLIATRSAKCVGLLNCRTSHVPTQTIICLSNSIVATCVYQLPIVFIVLDSAEYCAWHTNACQPNFPRPRKSRHNNIDTLRLWCAHDVYSIPTMGTYLMFRFTHTVCYNEWVMCIRVDNVQWYYNLLHTSTSGNLILV